MLRGHRLVLGALALLALPALEANAQYYYPYGQGYGGGGFGGFGGTIDGNIARGMGAFEEGAGVYNYDNAAANAINAKSIMGMNQYLYQSQLEANRREHAVMARRQANVNKAQGTALQIAQRLRDNPTEADIDSGAALNALLDQLSDPSVLSGSNLRMANAKLDSKLIRAVPFRDATDAITITLDQLTDEKSWPESLRDPSFDQPRQAYMKAVDEALEEDKNGDIKPATARKVRSAVSDLYKRVGETIPKTKQPDHLEATKYMKSLAGFSRMLEKPNVEKILAELEKIETTTVGHMVAFMHSYNLRFGAADTPAQKEAYQKLFPILVETRNKILGNPADRPKAGTPPPPAPGDVSPSNPGSIFHGMDDRHLHPQPGGVDPKANAGGTGPNLPGSPR